MSRINIMVVEDEVLIGRDTQNKLQSLGYEVCAVVRHGEMVLDAASAHHPDLILMDIGLMGAMDGVEAARLVRERLAIPVVFLTAHADEATLNRAKTVESLGFIKKPASREDLRIHAEMALHISAMEARLKQSEEKFRFLAENMGDIVWTLDRDLRTTYVSPSIVKILGFTPEQRKAQTLEQMVAPDSLLRITTLFADELARDAAADIDPERFAQIEIEYFHADGRVVWMENGVKAIRDKSGAITGVYGVSRDITARKRAEEALRQSEEKYRHLFENSPVGLGVFSREGNIIACNGAMLRQGGYSGDDSVYSSNIIDFFYDGVERDGVLEKLRRQGFLDEEEVRFKHKDGPPHHALVSLNPIIINNQKCWLAMAQDISERKKAERERENLIQRLQTALEEVKTLSGFIPICASCKKIRDDEGYWQKIEKYIEDRSKAQFSHGICPDCLRKLYPDVAGAILDKNKPLAGK
ncbi:MAG: PAS domain S-box protein [Pseudomonadota bacterium]